MSNEIVMPFYTHDKFEYFKEHVETLCNTTNYLNTFVNQYMNKNKIRGLYHNYNRELYADIETYLICKAQKIEAELTDLIYVLNSSETEYDYE
jgi:hypothetical protein